MEFAYMKVIVLICKYHTCDIQNLFFMMTIFRSYRSILIAALTILTASFISGCTSKEVKPNIVFILADDLGWYDLSRNGNPVVETPNIDMLASRSVVFENAYVSPLCTPTRAALMTGKYPGRLHMTRVVSDYDRGLTDDLGPYHPASRQKPGDRMDELSVNVATDLPLDEITLGEVAKHAGYTTGIIGKWHLGFDEYYPDYQGFDFVHRGDHWSDYFAPYQGERAEDIEAPDGEYVTDRLTDEALGFIKKNSKKKFLLCLWHYTIHTPIEAKPELVEYYQQKYGDQEGMHPVYAAMIHSLDESVGKVIDCLKEEGIYENSIVVFLSDNGPQTQTPEQGVYDPRIILNRRTADDAVEITASEGELVQIIDVPYADFRLGIAAAVPEDHERQSNEKNSNRNLRPVNSRLKVEVFHQNDLTTPAAVKVFNGKQLTGTKWNYMDVHSEKGSGSFQVRFSLLPDQYASSIALQSTKTSSIPDGTLIKDGTDTGGDLYLRCIPSDYNLGFWASLTSAGPFRGQKLQVYEGGVRVPFYFSWPAKIKDHRKINTPVKHIDILPTFANFMGAELEHDIDGVDLHNLIMFQEEISKRDHYLHYPHYMYTHGAEVIWRDSMKYIEFYCDGRKELYNLEKDPGEKENLIEKYPDLADALSVSLHEWLNDIDASMPEPLNPGNMQ
jgi:arylsulfatase A-like enzyme